MSDTSYLVISSDVLLARQLSDLLQSEHGIAVQTISGTHEIRGKLPRGGRVLVFYDLEKPDAWSELPLLPVSLGMSGSQPLAVVGLVRHGLPLEQCTVADTCLAATLMLPLESSAIAQVMEQFSAEEWHLRHTSPASPRVIEGATRRFITYTPSMYAMLDDLEVAARHDFTILIVGETGTGKTFLARLIHELSPRAANRFLTVACGALPSDLIDSELFGHVKGAFTGADRNKPGKFDAAESGSIFLDEIDVLGMDQQAKLLRVLETGEYEPVGSNETSVSNTRTIVASNLSLETLIAQERFRADLFFRLKQVKFDIPPLRARPRDIVPMAMLMIEECCRQHNLVVRQVSPEMLAVLKSYPWPGNIREMRNEVRRAVLFCRDGLLTPDLFSDAVIKEARQRLETGEANPVAPGLAGQVAQTEQDTIEQMLRMQNFNRAATARALGISRVTLYNKIRKYRIQIDDDRADD